MCLMRLKPRSIPWNMTVNMAEALSQWSSDACHPSEVYDGCTNQTHRATASPGILFHHAALTGCVFLATPMFMIISRLGKQNSKLKCDTKRRDAEHALATSYGTHLTGNPTSQQ